MLNQMHKNSKRGFALPTAVVVSCFIIIIATTLLGIAALSTQKTSGNTDSRQAYLNAKSALDYAARYYEEANLPDGSTGINDEYAEYMLMNDAVGGTTENGAAIRSLLDVSADANLLTNCKTYVYSVYNSSDSKITMTAYAKSSDSLGGHAESTTLSVTYDIGSAGNNMGRKLSTAPANTSNNFSSDDITIHVKQNANWIGDNTRYFVPAIYTWSYSKRNDLGIDWSKVKSVEDLTVSQANGVESRTSNILHPAGKWSDTAKGDPFDGPVTKMDAEGNEWYSHTFSPSKAGGTNGMVPWFNLIVSRQGSNAGSKADGTQSLELFDVWYFDENDRNIYVELLDKLLYYNDQNWNGKKNLEDRLIAYANAPQTVYYVKLEGTTDNSLNPTVVIDGKSYNANYSGYGWWSVRCENISGTKRVSVNITSSKLKNSIDIASVSSGSANSIMGNSAYIVIEPATDSSGNIIKNADGSTKYTGNTFLTEEAASVHMGDEDYVTVYGKAYNRKEAASPWISYKVETHNSSAAKLALKNAIADADQLYQLDYDPTSWGSFISVVNAAKEVYNKTTLQPNSVYNAEVTKIEDAKKNLKLKEADPTKLQQSYDKALTYTENDYTQESYDALKIVISQAKTLLDNMAHDKTSVHQETLDNKAIDLENKIAALEEIAPIRQALGDALTNARTVRDNNPGSKLINSLNSAITIGEDLYNNNSRNKTSIENATKSLNSIASRIQSGVNTDELETKIKTAQEYIDKDGSILVPGTVSNLQNVIDVINSSLTSSVLSQSEVDNYEAKLQSAIDELLYIPQDTTTEVPDGKKRVWFDIDAAGLGTNGSNYYIYAWYGAGGEGKQNIPFDTLKSTNESIKASFKLEKDTLSPYYYYDLDKKYVNAIIISGTGSSAKQSVDISLGEELTNNFFMVKSSTVKIKGNTKYNVDSAYLTTVYSPAEVPSSWGTAPQYAYVENSSNKVLDTASATADPLTVLDTLNKYYIKRVAFDSKSNFSLCNGTYKTTDIKLDSKEPVVVMFTDESNAFNVDSKSYTEFMKLAPKTEIQPISKNGSASIVNMSIKTVSTTPTAVYTDKYIPSNPIITVYFKKPTSGWLDKLYATLYQYDDSNTKLNEQTNRLLMTDDGNNYYITIDTRNTNALLIYDANSTKTSLVKLAVDSSTNKYFTAQQISGSGSSWKVSAYTASAVNIDTTDINDFDAKNQHMVFVGGRKRIFTNKADTRSGRNDANGIGLSSSRPFGGQWNGNDYGTGRVGITEYSIYYDWYEYKIPAGSSDLYTFEIKGLSNQGANVWTKQVHQVWGDVWVSLDNLDKSANRYTSVSVSTVNPDENVTATSTRIYVTPISSWVSNHGGMKVTMWGTGKQDVALSSTYDGRYYVDVPNNMPFLQFHSGDDSQILPMTKLQGGDVILYDYSAGKGGTPAWLTYVPAYMALNREIISASSVANGWYIYDYNTSTHATTNSYYPKKLLNMSKSYTPSESADPISQQADANNLAQWTIAYQNLYNAISNARIFITMDSSGNPVWYPENASNTTGAKYKDEQIKDLYDKAKEAVAEYASDSASLSKLISLAEELETLESLLTPVMTDNAIVILDDTAKWGNNIYLKYTDSMGTPRDVPVTSKNKDGYPMLYISIPSGQQITDVQFYCKTTGDTSATKSVIKSDEVWVCDNSASGAKAWTANNIENYFSYSIKSYTQSHVGDELILGETATSDKFILYFTYEVTVKYKESAGSAERSYKILPGAYLVDMKKYKTYHTGATPAPTKVNLYSTDAEKYFTDIVNQGYVKGAPFSDSLGWTTAGAINTHATPFNATDSVNFAASSGNLNGSYKAQNTLVFRWLSTKTLKVNNNTSMNAKEFVFASAGGISGGSTIAPKFILRNNPNGNEGNVKITFLTDTTISYKDSTGANISFIIPQGTYEAVNKGAINLFDSDWAKNFKGVGGSLGSGSDKYLSNPIYKIN